MASPRNEQVFAEYINGKCPSILKCKLSWKKESVFISADFHIETNKYIYLIEVDASNQAKLIVGQYLLINLLKDFPTFKTAKQLLNKKKSFRFIVIHFYKNYNQTRSVLNMEMINNEVFEKKGIPSASIHFNDFQKETTSFNSVTAFGKFFEQMTKYPQSKKVNKSIHRPSKNQKSKQR